ncbi:polyhydroxyalkanoic acid system family protein [Xanthobacter dioxanivorans]|uniref:Polyhydroxyalkanoic acid system family protein n=1 Tax=Xanthobacter dioxanivorans TaxID=2528964 RepID=A0A974SKY4_9HYPH|nr:polyhydroxyalkanoic acid system family protein [Xanthobacter dioxanivorans]QRG08003.1 polyhydroxyalkanoic acid system family protein [Xanthobacter dioxanivorans]
MGQPFTASIPHRLGQAEAVRRLQVGLTTVRDRFGRHITLLEEVWTGAHLDFRIAALTQTANGTLDVTDDAVHLSVELPFLLDLLARKAQGLIKKQGTLMLEKK